MNERLNVLSVLSKVASWVFDHIMINPVIALPATVILVLEIVVAIYDPNAWNQITQSSLLLKTIFILVPALPVFSFFGLILMACFLYLVVMEIADDLAARKFWSNI